MEENSPENEKQEENNEEEEEEEHEDEEKEIPVPIPVLDEEQKDQVEEDDEKSKYQKELEAAKKKSSAVVTRKKRSSVDIKTIKQTNKVTRSDILSKLEEADIKDQSNPHNQKFMPFDEFKGPAAKRKKTNTICLFIFIILNGGLFVNAMLVFVNGSSNRLMNGTDFRAEICGVDQRTDLPYLYYLEPTVDINVAMCVSSCPNSTGSQICLYKSDAVSLTPYCYTQIQTKTRGKYCIPTEPINKAAIETELNKFDNYIKRIAGDLGQAADIVCLGCVLSIFIAWFFNELLKSEKYAKFVVWGCIWGTVGCITVLAIMCYMEYLRTIEFSCLFGIDKHNCGGSGALGFYYGFIGLMCLNGVYLLLVMKLFNNINLAIGIIKASGKVSKVLDQMKKIPLIIVGIALVIGIFLLTMIIMAFSIGTIKIIAAKNINGGFVKVIEYDNTYRLYLIGDFAMLIYWFLVIIGFSDLVTSYSLCIWFFTKTKETVLLPVQRALKDTIVYHLGTILLIVLLTPLSAIPKALFGNLKKILKKSNQKSCLIKFTISSIMCCFYLYDRFFRFHSYQTYVQVAMWSLPHGKASQKAYFLVKRHESELRNIDFLQRFVLFQAKVCCSLISCIFVYIFISYSPKSIIGNDLKAVETPFGPAMFVLFIAFFFSTIFQGSFDIIGKTILQCYLMDIEMFIGDQRYIEPFLRDFLQFFGLKAEKKKIEVEAERPQYIIGVTVQPLPQEKEIAKPDLEIEDFSESEEEEEGSDDSKNREDSAQSIELMPVASKKQQPKQVSRGDTGSSRPGTGQSGVEGFQAKKNEAGRELFLDDVNNGKKAGIEYDPFSYAPVKGSSNNPSRPVSKDLPGNTGVSRPATNDMNKLSINSRPMSKDVNNLMARPISNDFNKPVSRPLSKDINNNWAFNPPNNNMISSNNTNNNINRPVSNSLNNINPSKNNLSRPFSKDDNKGGLNFNQNNMTTSKINSGNQIIEIRPNSKGIDNKPKEEAKLELIESRPVSKDSVGWGASGFIKPQKQENSRPNSKDLFLAPKNKKSDDSESIDLFHQSRMNDDTIKFENFSMDGSQTKNVNKGNKPGYRLN